MLVVAVLLVSALFGASLDHLVSSPRLFANGFSLVGASSNG